MTVALIALYNHHYPQNVDRINSMYRDRFSHVRHVIPNYSGDRDDVIPVFGNGHQFSNFVAQAYHHIRHLDADHYLFVADDLVINPQIDESNTDTWLGLRADTCFFPRFVKLWELDQYYPVAHDAYRWRPTQPGAEVAGLLPSREEALRRFAQAGYPVAEVPWNVVHLPAVVRGNADRKIDSGQRHNRVVSRVYDTPRGRAALRMAYRAFAVPIGARRGSVELAYPLIAGYSDIFGISAGSLRDFSTYCGLFAAGGLYCEAAVPSAMLLTTSDLVTEDDLEVRGAPLGPEAIIADQHWHVGRHRDFAAEFGGDFQLFLDTFPPEVLYYHPVKLSTFN